MHAPWPAPGTPIDYSHLSVNPTSLECPPPAVAATAEAPPIARTVATPGPGIEREPRASEPMMAVGQGFTLVNAYRATGWPGTADEVWLRPTVVDRLVAARAALPSGFGLAIYDGWRSPETVRALYAHYYGTGSTLEPGFLADPDRPGPPPPHLTGAAVDLTLTWSGHALSLGTPFDEFSDRAHLASLSEFHTFTPTLTNEFRAAYGRRVEDRPVVTWTVPSEGPIACHAFTMRLSTMRRASVGSANTGGR